MQSRREMQTQHSIRDFFNAQTVFLTGGTGFVGKVLVEKLLRECPGAKIYLLVRPKKGKTTKERFNEIFTYPCFDNVRSLPDLRNRVFLVEGDCEKESLGLTLEDRALLADQVTCVIHAAANVKFNQSLRVAGGNVRAVRDVVALAKTMSRLEAFVYVSTAFSNCIRPSIAESTYTPPMHPDDFLTLISKTTDSTLDTITPSLLDTWPNTYVFAKSISEAIIQEEAANLPVTIVRPAIVANSLQEPTPGWIDNFYGVVGICVAAALGVLRTLHADPKSTAYLVPCDYVANFILASAFDVAKNHKNRKSMMVYNFVGSKTNLIDWSRLMSDIESCAMDYPSEKLVWYYCFKLRKNKMWNQICVFLLHTIPAHIVDFIFICLRRQPIAVSNYKRLDRMLSMISYFTTRNWSFDTSNVENLFDSLSEDDKRIFKFTMDDLNWKQYFRISVQGGRRYLLKDPPETIPQGRKKLRLLFVSHYLLLSLLLLLLLWFLRCVFALMCVL